jgi:hypothetical protein
MNDGKASETPLLVSSVPLLAHWMNFAPPPRHGHSVPMVNYPTGERRTEYVMHPFPPNMCVQRI